MRIESKRGVIFICSVVFMLSGLLMFADHSQAQIKIDERENSGRKSQSDYLLKKKSGEEGHEKSSSDEQKIFSDDSDEEPLSPEEGPYNPADQPSGAPTK